LVDVIATASVLPSPVLLDDGLSGYFGCLGPELDEWITTELAAPQLVVTGQRTYEALAGLPDEARDESGMTQLDKVVFSRTMGSRSLARELMSASLVDRLRLMIFPLIAGTQGARRSSQTWRPPTLN
jgi:riboflavin biosynthesis pyrimidine reductase